jgi:ABC-type Fe3+ transport system permease subunit
MKRLLRIFELTKNEQRVVLIVMLILVTIAFIGYQRRLRRSPVQLTSTTKAQASPSPVQTEDER